MEPWPEGPDLRGSAGLLPRTQAAVRPRQRWRPKASADFWRETWEQPWALRHQFHPRQEHQAPGRRSLCAWNSYPIAGGCAARGSQGGPARLRRGGHTAAPVSPRPWGRSSLPDGGLPWRGPSQVTRVGPPLHLQETWPGPCFCASWLSGLRQDSEGPAETTGSLLTPRGMGRAEDKASGPPPFPHWPVMRRCPGG